MEQFSLEKYLENPSRKVITRDRRPVRIVCWDVKGLFPILGLIVGNGERDTKVGEEYPCCYKVDGTCPVSDSYDLFFADDKKTNKILDELKSYLKNTPKEQVEKDWKEIQDWYVHHFTNEKHDVEEELTEFEKKLQIIISDAVHWTSDDGSICYFGDKEIKKISGQLLDLARKEIEKENSEFKPKFTYNEKDYSKLANKLIEFRNNTPLCSVSYRDGEGREVILHYEKEILDLVKNEVLKDFPKWKKAKESRHSPYGAVKIDEDGEIIYSDIIWKGEYFIMLQSLKTLSKEE
jgi:hypothetical protein